MPNREKKEFKEFEELQEFKENTAQQNEAPLRTATRFRSYLVFT